MTEAKKRNPHIKLYGLPWSFPGWIGNGTQNPYIDPNTTANYMIKWVQGMKRHYNLDIDYLGQWNERGYSVEYIVTLRNQLDLHGLSHIKLIAPDGRLAPKFAEEVLKNKTLKDSIIAIGDHYPGWATSEAKLQTGLKLWASEDFRYGKLMYTIMCLYEFQQKHSEKVHLSCNMSEF